MGEIQQKSFIGRSQPRKEDRRLLLGQGQYVADLMLPRTLHAAFVRSNVAHARISSFDVSAALASPGTVMVMTGADLAQILPPVPDHQVALPSKWEKSVRHNLLNPQQPLLAHDKVRHVGEAVAVVIADSRYAAEDAAELVQVEYETLPAIVDPERGLDTDAAVLHEQYKTNLIGEFTVGYGDAAATLAEAPFRITKRFHHHRYAAIPMEGRGVIASFDPRTESVTVWSSTQVVHWVRREVARVLGMPETRVRCVALDVGGGFGVKGHVYPEDILLPFLSRKLGRPVRWIEDRNEHLMASCHSRDQIHDVEIGFDGTGRILALKDDFIVDCGAWNPVGVAPFYNTAAHLVGPYKIPAFEASCRIVATNKVPNAPYRGAGRPEAVLAMERSIDLVAARLGLEPAEVRRRNMITAAEMPYSVGIPYRDGEPVVYDGGDYPAALENALNGIGGVEAFRKRQSEALRSGKRLGLGIACYTEGTGAGPFEGAVVRIDASGSIHISSGSCPQGQGMETVFSQLAADLWSVDPKDVTITLADTSAIAQGFGTIASRSTVNLSGAIHVASERLREKVFAIAGHMLECSPQDLELREGKVGIVGVPGSSVSLRDVARAASPGWDHGRPANVESGLEVTYYFEPPTVTWSYSAHATIVEVDLELGRVAIRDYAIAHDCGRIVNPMLVDGQILGGAAQGIGGALLERFNYDEQGQLLTGSLMEYLVPTASDMPEITLVHMETPTPLNPFGVKGVGEGGAIAPPAAIANAVTDALAEFGAEFNSTPITPEDIYKKTCKKYASGI